MALQIKLEIDNLNSSIKIITRLNIFLLMKIETIIHPSIFQRFLN